MSGWMQSARRPSQLSTLKMRLSSHRWLKVIRYGKLIFLPRLDSFVIHMAYKRDHEININAFQLDIITVINSWNTNVSTTVWKECLWNFALFYINIKLSSTGWHRLGGSCCQKSLPPILWMAGFRCFPKRPFAFEIGWSFRKGCKIFKWIRNPRQWQTCKASLWRNYLVRRNP